MLLLMMRLLTLCCLLLALFTCRETATAQSDGSGPVTGTVAANGKLQQSPTDEGSGTPLILRMASAEAGRNTEVCLPVEAQDFQNLIGFQFTMRFDSSALRYERVQNFRLPGHSPNSVGTRFADRGYLSTLWTEGSLKGVSLPDRTALFEVCFTNLMPAGRETSVRFQDGPTTFEVIDAGMGQHKIRYANGRVRSR